LWYSPMISAALIIGEYHKFLWSWLRLEVVHVAGARPAAEGTPA